MFSKEELPPSTRTSKITLESSNNPLSPSSASLESNSTGGTPQRKNSKVNVSSVESPFSQQPYELAKPSPRARSVSQESSQFFPDSTGKTPSLANAQSGDSPFSDGKQIRPTTPRRPSAIQTNPNGGKPHINIFQGLFLICSWLLLYAICALFACLCVVGLEVPSLSSFSLIDCRLSSYLTFQSRTTLQTTRKWHRATIKNKSRTDLGKC